jgi:hypothetical protein
MPHGLDMLSGRRKPEPKKNPVEELVGLSRGGTPRRDGKRLTHSYSDKASVRAADLMAGLTYEDARAYTSKRGRRSGFDPFDALPITGGRGGPASMMVGVELARQGKPLKNPTGLMTASDRAAFLTRVGGFIPPESRSAYGAFKGGTLGELTGGGMSVLGGRARTKRAAGRVTEPLAARRARMKTGERSRASRLLSTGQALGSAGVLG